jgi:hypothetical protein
MDVVIAGGGPNGTRAAQGPGPARRRPTAGAHGRTHRFPGVTYDRTTSRTVHATMPTDWLDPATGGLLGRPGRHADRLGAGEGSRPGGVPSA